MTRIKIHISNVKLPFYPLCEVKCRLQNRVSTMYFWAFSSISTIVRGGFFISETTNSLDFNPTLKAVNCTLSSASSTFKVSQVKRFTYDLRVSLSPCLIVNKWFVGLFGCYPSTKWCKKELLSCSKLSMDEVGNFVNHSLTAPLRVVRKDQHNISSRGC